MVVSNPWWISEPEQRYWMEITHRPDNEIGENLHCPAGPAVTDELVGYVQPGDRILHWKKATARVPGALVGWSEAIAPPIRMPEPYDGREIDCLTVRLGGLRRFTQPVTSASLLPLLDGLVDLQVRLKAEHGNHIYFPFIPHDRQGKIRIQAPQGYSAKFPVELFDLIPGIGSARIDADALSADDADDVAEDDQPPRAKAPSGRATRAQDPVLRKAIEDRAVDSAIEYYVGIGGVNPRKLGKPYDIAVTVDGVERHCEVKGSKMKIDTVELTINEVNHPKDPNKDYSMDLIVVDSIDITRDDTTGEIRADGGRRRVWSDWSPSDKDLRPKKFNYELPGGYE
jgi:hypothetical protein